MSSFNSNSKGISTLTLLVFGAIIGLSVFAASKLIPIFYGYYELNGQLAAIARRGDTLDNQEIRKRVSKIIQKMEIPTDVDDLKIYRREQEMEISLRYTELFYIPFGLKDINIHRFHFHAHAEEPYVAF